MEQDVVLVATITLIVLVVIIIILFGTFQARKNKYIQAEKKFEEEIAKSQMEIHEQALKNMGWELHDNIGQLLSVARMQLNILQAKLPDGHKEETVDVSEILGDCLKEIRLLSKTLNPDIIREMGLVRSIELELERFNKLNFLKAKLSVQGEEYMVPQKDGIILFRILQEFFSNVIKHSKAQHLDVNLEYSANKLLISAKDDGIGFDYEEVIKGAGLINMKSRAKLIGAEYNMVSAKNKGVELILEYNLTQKSYA
ncbi:histidine kinase [Fulvivirga ulvae]|uniref:sensor histidine kinase n=1 Tax=Fulvivirga ulvae TaxID=2904245 RepID=UPI001F3A3A18|nr:histidine kinase [Fulvivirga ulvae]UII31523.1 histidine kinase [Fulvivirga ulvae]